MSNNTLACKANNKYMGKKYDKNIESLYFMYLDGNNLHGLAIVVCYTGRQHTSFMSHAKPRQIIRLYTFISYLLT